MQVFLCLLYLIYRQTSGMDARTLHNDQKEVDLYVRSICKPRETLVRVKDEFPELQSGSLLPPCVSLRRCGGCCSSDEAMLCVSVSNHITTMQLKQLDMNTVELAFVEHSRCECRFKDQL